MLAADLQDDLKLLREAALASGAIAMTYFQSELSVWDKEPNHPVTEADIAVNDYLMDFLRTARPDYGWLSEETADTPDRMNCERVFVVDPIDGTRAFMNGQPHFCIALAILDAGQPVVGVIYAPVFDELFEAVHQQGATMNGCSIQASRKNTLINGRIIGDQAMFERPEWKKPWPPLVYPDVKPNATAYRMALVADGRWDGVLVLWSKSDWDVAAATLIVHEAGGKVSCHNGTPYQFNRKVAAQQSLIAAGPVIHELMVERCRSISLPDPNDS